MDSPFEEATEPTRRQPQPRPELPVYPVLHKEVHQQLHVGENSAEPEVEQPHLDRLRHRLLHIAIRRLATASVPLSLHLSIPLLSSFVSPSRAESRRRRRGP